jgi:cation diffusion facilitator family transporter
MSVMNVLPGKAQPHSDSGIRVTLFGLVINVALSFIKLIVGVFAGSVALVADGIHSASDIATDLAVLGGMRLSLKPADPSHPYGHGRYETLAGGLVAGALILVGLYIAWKAGSALYAQQEVYPGLVVVLVATVSVLAKEWVYRRTIRVARRLRSPALHANAWHHRSDALSSVAVLIGGLGGLLGWGHADQVAGIVVGLMVVVAGGRTVRDVLHELVEGSLSRVELETIQAAIEQVPAVLSWHALRTRSVGREPFVDLHVLVDPTLSLLQGHRISMQVEEAVKSACKRPVNVMVHVEPDTPELSEHNRPGTS